MGDLADVDPVALARAHLLTHPRVRQVLGEGDRITPDNEPPYPRLLLSDPPGDDRTLTHLVAPLLQIEALGDPDGSVGKPALRRVLYTALQALAELPTQPVTDPAAPVVTAVTSSGGGGWSPYPNGQGRYLATVRIHAHPGRPAST